MGRLTGQVAYLSGAIDRCPNLGTEWRNWIKPILKEKYNVDCFDPMSKPVTIANEHESRALRHKWKQNGQYHKLQRFMKEVRHVDLRLCDKADFGVFYIDVDIHACGTYEELSWINREYKPCLIICKQGVKQLPDWLFGLNPISFLFNSFEEMFDYLDDVDDEMKQLSSDSGKRWVFFKQ